MALPRRWNRSRSAALAATLLLHLALALWLLSARFEPAEVVRELEPDWWPALLEPLPPVLPPASKKPEEPSPVAPITAPPLPMPELETPLPSIPDWGETAREVARGFGGSPGQRGFGEPLEQAPGAPKKPAAEPFWKKPLQRVGTTVVTPEGETIVWVSDYCYVSVASRSIALQEIHKARNGVRTCILAEFGGKKSARDDLFEPIKRPPPPQDPGCAPDGTGQSCGR